MKNLYLYTTVMAIIGTLVHISTIYFIYDNLASYISIAVFFIVFWIVFFFVFKYLKK